MRNHALFCCIFLLTTKQNNVIIKQTEYKQGSGVDTRRTQTSKVQFFNKTKNVYFVVDICFVVCYDKHNK